MPRSLSLTILLILAGCASEGAREPTAVAPQRQDSPPLLRAIGQEPGWLLEIREDGTTELLSSYGARRRVWETPEPVKLDDGLTRFSLARPDISVTVEEQPCQDIMSGEHFPLRVVVETPRERLEGCGERKLAD